MLLDSSFQCSIMGGRNRPAERQASESIRWDENGKGTM